MKARQAPLAGLAFVCALAGACDGRPLTTGSALQGCPDYHAPASCTDVPSFATTITPILQKSCVPCHWGAPGDNALWPLTEYSDVAAWNDLIKASLLACSQPPPGTGYSLSERDRQTILKWTSCNHPP